MADFGSNQIGNLDPVTLEQAAKYINNGLTTISNNTDIIPRDANGNIIVKDDSYIVIETNSFNINNNAVLKVLDTQFNYFKFPVSVNTNLIDVDTDFSVENNIDPIFTRYKPRYVGSSLGAIPNSNDTPVGFNFEEVVRGNSQVSRNRYTISTATKASGADLRFRVKIKYRCDSPLSDNPGQTVRFTIIKQGPDNPIDREYIQFGIEPVATLYQVLGSNLDVVIPNSSFEIGDEFQIGGRSVPEAADFSIYSEQSYWVITDASKNVNEWNQELPPETDGVPPETDGAS